MTPRPPSKMTRCPSPGRLARAATAQDGRDDALEAHALDCPRCGAALDDARAVVMLARAAPAPALSAARRQRLADAVQVAADAADAAPAARPRWASAVVGVALAAAAGGALWLSLRDPARSATRARPPEVAAAPAPAAAPTPPEAEAEAPATEARSPEAEARASVVALADADYERVDGGAEDRVVLRGGAIVVDGAAAPGRAVRVVSAGAELRGQGARFEARGDRRGLRVVRVFAGSVEIDAGARTVSVSRGETWTWEPPADEPRAPSSVAARGGDGGDATATTAAATAAFHAGWTSLRAGDFARAARELDAARAAPAVAEDATYWAAVAWARAGEPARARAGFEAFLAGFAGSPRAGEAHLALARLLRDAGEAAAAAAHVEAAARDADPRVREAAGRMRGE